MASVARPTTGNPASSVPLVDRDLAGFVLGESYRLISPIGNGGMSMVYEAQHLRLGRHVAVKLMASCLVADQYALGRFRREAELLSRLHHPHIVQVLDFDTTADGEPYLVMELLQGEPLDRRLMRQRVLPLSHVVRLVAQLASALSLAHELSIVHRDLKPGNIFLERVTGEEPYAKLLDFGISKTASGPRLTVERALVGTPEYMAPEQAFGGREVDHRTDQYALALVAYEALSGQHPFFHDDPLEVLDAVRRSTPPSLSRIADVPHAVSSAIAKAMSKQPEDRFGSIQELAAALRAAAPEQLARHSRTTLRQERSGPRACTTPPVEPLSAPAAEALVSGVRAALDARDLDGACRLAQQGLAALEHATDARARALLELSLPLFEHVFATRIGGSARRVRSSAAGDPASWGLSPAEAFVLSRLDGELTVEELLDVSALPRAQALRALARLLDQGLAQVA